MFSSKKFCVLLFVLAVGSQGARATDATLAEIWQHFEERQNAATTARVSWTTEMYHSGTVAAGFLKGTNLQKYEAVKGSLETQSPPSPRKLVISGPTAIRYENAGRSFAGVNSGALVRSTTAVTSNGLYQSLHESSPGSDKYSGVIKKREAAPAWGQAHIKPLVWALRPLRREAFGQTQEKWELIDKPAMIDGRECIVIRMMMRAMIVEVFLDPARNYIPLRSTITRTDKKNKPVVVRSDVRYDRKQEPLWIPSGWTTTVWMLTGAIAEKSENSDVEVELGIPIPASAFNIDYPSGSHVLDSRPTKTKPVVVADNGELVPFRSVQTQETAANSGYWLWLWIWIAFAIAGGAVLAIAIFLRKRGIA